MLLVLAWGDAFYLLEDFAEVEGVLEPQPICDLINLQVPLGQQVFGSRYLHVGDVFDKAGATVAAEHAAQIVLTESEEESHFAEIELAVKVLLDVLLDIGNNFGSVILSAALKLLDQNRGEATKVGRALIG